MIYLATIETRTETGRERWNVCAGDVFGCSRNFADAKQYKDAAEAEKAAKQAAAQIFKEAEQPRAYVRAYTI